MRGRKYQIIAVAAIVVVLAAVCVGALVAKTPHLSERSLQHEEVQQLADLPEADRAAASGTSIDAASFASHLPVVSIDTAGQTIPGERVYEDDGAAGADGGPDESLHAGPVTLAPDGRTTIPTAFSLFSSEGAANRLSDEAAISTQAELRIRGHSSRLFDKKSYSVRFTEQDRLTDRNLDVLGMGSDEEWVLNGPFIDKTMLRNYLSLNVAGQFMPYTPDVRFCELFIDGQYQGVYLLMETIKHGDDRVAISDSDPKSSATSYIVRRDWSYEYDPTSIQDMLNATFLTRGTALDIVYPSSTDITEEQRAWISDDIIDFEKALYSFDYDTSHYGYWNYIDPDTFVNFAVMNEFAGNTDAGLYSTFFYKDVRGRLCAGPVWDFNNAYDNYMDVDTDELGFILPEKPLYFMLFKDEEFVNAVIQRYQELRQTVLSDSQLEALIDQTVAYLGPAIERNYQVWGYSFDPANVDASNKLHPDERNPLTYEAAVEQLKTAIEERGAWLDRNIEHLRQYAHESVNKRFNH